MTSRPAPARACTRRWMLALGLALAACAGCRAPTLPGAAVRAAEVAPGSREAAVLAELRAFYADFSARDWALWASDG